MFTLTKWADANSEFTTVVRDMVWAHIKDWHTARDIKPEITPAACQALADQIGVEWQGRTDEDGTQMAVEILQRLGFRVASGTIGFDATLATK
jgi:hypothetical protein